MQDMPERVGLASLVRFTVSPFAFYVLGPLFPSECDWCNGLWPVQEYPVRAHSNTASDITEFSCRLTYGRTHDRMRSLFRQACLRVWRRKMTFSHAPEVVVLASSYSFLLYELHGMTIGVYLAFELNQAVALLPLHRLCI